VSDADPFDGLRAETAYLFRHAVLRDAAYALQPPTVRSALHLLAARLMIDVYQQDVEGARDFLADEIIHHLGIDPDTAAEPWVLEQRRRFTERAAIYAGSQYRGVAAVRLWRDLAAICDPGRRARVLYRAGCAARELSVGHDVAELVLREALEVARRDNDPVAVAIRATLGFVLRQGLKLDEGKRLLEEALAEGSARGDREGEALALQYLSSVYRDAGQYEQGMLLSEQAARLHQAAGNVRGEGLARGDMAMSANNSGKFDVAINYLQQALALLREAGDVRAEGIYTGGLAAALLNSGRLTEAGPLYAKSIAIHRQVGNARGLSFDLTASAALLIAQGRLQEAELHLDEALRIRSEIGGIWLLGTIHRQRAALLTGLGRMDAAVAASHLAVSLTLPTQNPVEITKCRVSLTVCLIKAGRIDEAREAWKAATLEMPGGVGAASNQGYVRDVVSACEAAGVAAFT